MPARGIVCCSVLLSTERGLCTPQIETDELGQGALRAAGPAVLVHSSDDTEMLTHAIETVLAMPREQLRVLDGYEAKAELRVFGVRSQKALTQATTSVLIEPWDTEGSLRVTVHRTAAGSVGWEIDGPPTLVTRAERGSIGAVVASSAPGT